MAPERGCIQYIASVQYIAAVRLIIHMARDEREQMRPQKVWPGPGLCRVMRFGVVLYWRSGVASRWRQNLILDVCVMIRIVDGDVLIALHCNCWCEILLFDFLSCLMYDMKGFVLQFALVLINQRVSWEKCKYATRLSLKHIRFTDIVLRKSQKQFYTDLRYVYMKYKNLI